MKYYSQGETPDKAEARKLAIAKYRQLLQMQQMQMQQNNRMGMADYNAGLRNQSAETQWNRQQQGKQGDRAHQKEMLYEQDKLTRSRQKDQSAQSFKQQMDLARFNSQLKNDSLPGQLDVRAKASLREEEQRIPLDIAKFQEMEDYKRNQYDPNSDPLNKVESTLLKLKSDSNKSVDMNAIMPDITRQLVGAFQTSNHPMAKELRRYIQQYSEGPEEEFLNYQDAANVHLQGGNPLAAFQKLESQGRTQDPIRQRDQAICSMLNPQAAPQFQSNIPPIPTTEVAQSMGQGQTMSDTPSPNMSRGAGMSLGEKINPANWLRGGPYGLLSGIYGAGSKLASGIGSLINDDPVAKYKQHADDMQQARQQMDEVRGMQNRFREGEQELDMVRYPQPAQPDYNNRGDQASITTPVSTQLAFERQWEEENTPEGMARKLQPNPDYGILPQAFGMDRGNIPEIDSLAMAAQQLAMQRDLEDKMRRSKLDTYGLDAWV